MEGHLQKLGEVDPQFAFRIHVYPQVYLAHRRTKRFHQHLTQDDAPRILTAILAATVQAYNVAISITVNTAIETRAELVMAVRASISHQLRWTRISWHGIFCTELEHSLTFLNCIQKPAELRQ